MEAALNKAYGIRITPTEIDGEVKRINSTTRAPEILAELKQALGNNSERFARAVAKPIIVERELRSRFENDARLHAQTRTQTERLRNQLLAAKKTNAPVAVLLAVLKQSQPATFNERTWQLTARRLPESVNLNSGSKDVLQVPAKSSAGPYLLEGTATFGPAVSAPVKDPGAPFLYFGDLPLELQRVLQAQLKAAGDVSAVVEASGGFLLFIATAKTAQTLAAASVQFSKWDFEQWVGSISF